ncbi:MAG: U32 family peptidase [Desulfobacteraceae bacterium]|nr:U32 family peptidase [Desulfobacteraceae bacterium]
MNQPRPRIPLSKPELLSPGGSLEKLRIAFLYGADAVYTSGKDFGLRGFAHNLDSEELAAAVYIAHRLGRKVYITVNIFARERDFKELPTYLEYLQEIGADALIVSDPGVLLTARRYAPGLDVHLSTQANTTNSAGVLFWEQQGISRVNLARELSFDEISEIAVKSRIELEVFVHGAMCMSYSGRCLMSAFLNNRSANGGFCTQPCRWSYSLVEEKRPGQFFPVEEDGRGTYIFNSRDLCLIEELGRLASLGVASFKIEGRMKGALYLASVTRAYRRGVDRAARSAEAFEVEQSWLDDLQRVSHRPYTKGSLFPRSGEADIASQTSYVQTHTLAGLVRPCAARNGEGKICMETRSRLIRGRLIEFLHPDGTSRFHRLESFEDMNGNSISEAHPNRLIRFAVDFPVFPFQVARMEKDHFLQSIFEGLS